ncbi:T9SS type A sorting domain-containing protein, partial [Salibacter halophilus]
CYGDNQGMVSVEGQGGVGNYTYYWGNGDTDSTRSGLNVNTTHNVTITDGNGCQATASYTIFEPDELEVMTNSYNPNAGCENQIGLISVSANGGTSPYSYNWNNGSTSSGLNGLSGGNYTVTITDDNGCTVSETYPVYDLDVSITNLTPTLIANLSGATYQWIDCDSGQPVDGATSDTFTPEDNGTYAVVITSGNCTDTSRCVEVLNTSTEDLIGGEHNSFKIYPNPTRGEFTMSFGSSAKNVEYELINAQGSVIERRVIGDVQEGQQVVGNINAAPGIYFVRTISDQNQS